ncbi:unnamed protein product, partial [Musa acuminata subsp. burmannicoides]
PKQPTPSFSVLSQVRLPFSIQVYQSRQRLSSTQSELSLSGTETMATIGSNSINAKLVLLGDMGAGKSSLVLRFVKGQFLEFQESTIGAAFFSQTLAVSDATVKLEIWDTAGQERYHSLAPMYYRGAAAAIIVYNISRMESFEKAKKWVQELQKQGSPNLVTALAGNKCDLDDKREVPTEANNILLIDAFLSYMNFNLYVAVHSLIFSWACSLEARTYAEENGLLFMETSAKTAINVNDIFYEIVQMPKYNPSGVLSGSTADQVQQRKLIEENSVSEGATRDGSCEPVEIDKRYKCSVSSSPLLFDLLFLDPVDLPFCSRLLHLLSLTLFPWPKSPPSPPTRLAPQYDPSLSLRPKIYEGKISNAKLKATVIIDKTKDNVGDARKEDSDAYQTSLLVEVVEDGGFVSATDDIYFSSFDKLCAMQRQEPL